MANDGSKEDLINRIQELEALLEAYRTEKEEAERLDYAWTGNLGHWYWNCQNNTVTFNPLKVTTLGYDSEEVPENCGFQYFTDKLHPDNYEATMTAMRDHLAGKKPVYETEYRIRTKHGKWKWFHDIGRITKRDAEGQPLLVAGIVFDITERKELQHQIEEQNKLLEILATTDELTKILNRRMVYSRLEEEISRANRFQTPLSILLMDIDHFKRVNDQYGHLRGDDVLVKVAATISTEARNYDIVGRYGGEEFLVVLPNTEQEEALIVAQRIRKRISRLEFENDLRVTISGGLKTYQGGSATEFLNQTDELLYKAKEQGRDQIVNAN